MTASLPRSTHVLCAALLLIGACGGSQPAPAVQEAQTEPAKVVTPPGETTASDDTTPGMATRFEPAKCSNGELSTFHDASVTFAAVDAGATVGWSEDVFELQVDARPGPGGLIVTATVRNISATVQPFDFLTGGIVGVSTNPFIVSVEGAPPSDVTPGPEVYPSPNRANLAPGARLQFMVAPCGPTSGRVNWTLSPWSGALRGTLDVN
jgi:hypothetical protein